MFGDQVYNQPSPLKVPQEVFDLILFDRAGKMNKGAHREDRRNQRIISLGQRVVP